ncbi:hypothetical protein [Blastococcus sp. URHD0036]|uniref:hypothetical protein n=1 Tax=Blastococcus sp. URHD0036 TaxID=1380356 RepID=UPI0012DD2034|nr:hypothetical protein [Blastococcus sp. URHD0036]
MPSAPRRSPRAAPVRSGVRPAAPHPLARGVAGRPVPRERPLTLPFAVVFAGLVAAEELYLGWLLWEPDPGWHWYVFVAAALAAWTVGGAVLVWQGRPRAWLVLTGAGTLPLLLLVGLAVLFGALGGGEALWWALLMLAGPLGCLVLTAGRPIREWTAPRRGASTPSRTRRSSGAG